MCREASDRVPSRLLPETKGLSLEEMDVMFGAVDWEARKAFIQKEARALGVTSLDEAKVV